MKKPADKIAADDAAMFRSAMGDVHRMPGQNRIEPQRAPQKQPARAPLPPAAPDTLSDFAAGDAPETFLREGLSHMTLRRLRRGHWPIQDTLDLHGNRSDEARKLLQEFLHDACRRRLRCVLVIHGKGINSQGGEAVLRKLARHWLTQRGDVLAFCDALPGRGGSGAAVVLLKSAGTGYQKAP